MLDRGYTTAAAHWSRAAYGSQLNRGAISMVSQTSENTPTRPIMDRAERDSWVRQVHQLPNIRVEKVVAVRAALRRNRYDNDQILSETIDRVERAIAPTS